MSRTSISRLLVLLAAFGLFFSFWLIVLSTLRVVLNWWHRREMAGHNAHIRQASTILSDVVFVLAFAYIFYVVNFGAGFDAIVAELETVLATRWGSVAIAYALVIVPAHFAMFVAHKVRTRADVRSIPRARSVWLNESAGTVSWREEIPTFDTVGGKRKQAELVAMALVVVSGAAIGWYSGGWEGAAFGLLIGLYLSTGVDRYSTAPRLENVGGYAPMPGRWGERSPSDAERQLEARAVTVPGEAQAFIEWEGGDWLRGNPWLVVQARRNGRVVERLCIPWVAMTSIEGPESYGKFFASKADPLVIADPNCIIVRHTHGDRHNVEWIAIDMAGLARMQAVFLDIFSRFGVEARAAKMDERKRLRREQNIDDPVQPDSDPITPDPIGRTRPVL